MEQYRVVEEAFEDNQTERCGVSNGGIRVPGLGDHYTNPPTMFIYHLLDIALDFIHTLALNFIHPHSGALFLFVEPYNNYCTYSKEG